MTFPASTLRVSIKEGPVHFSPPHTSGIDARYPLWSSIESEEQFPAVEGSAFYTVILEKTSPRLERSWWLRQNSSQL